MDTELLWYSDGLDGGQGDEWALRCVAAVSCSLRCCAQFDCCRCQHCYIRRRPNMRTYVPHSCMQAHTLHSVHSVHVQDPLLIREKPCLLQKTKCSVNDMLLHLLFHVFLDVSK